MFQSSSLGVILAAGNRSCPNDHFLFCPIAATIAKSVDSYLVTSIARLIQDRLVLIPASLIGKDLCIESIVYERT